MGKYILFIIPALLVLSCEMRPKKIQADETFSQFDQSHEHYHKPHEPDGSGKVTAVADEVLHSERYTYLKVFEGKKSYWIATASTDVVPGNTISYYDGLLRVNFESQEFKRVFDTIYLVNNVIVADVQSADPSMAKTDPETDTKKFISDLAGSISLEDLFINKEKYEGKIVTVAGNVIKVNRNIMGMDWVHITDNSLKNGRKLELTITTNSTVSPDEKAVFKGKISLNKDFGYGYRYDILMEEAERL
jgi:hypothetical protein